MDVATTKIKTMNRIRLMPALILVMLIFAGISVSTISHAGVDASNCQDIDIRQNINCYRMAIKHFLDSWVTGWGDGDVEAYFSHYTSAWSPKSGVNRARWEQQRRRAIQGKTGIRVSLALESMRLRKDGLTEVVFRQSYQSPTYRDKVVKKLVLTRDGNSFKIFTEQALETIQP